MKIPRLAFAGISAGCGKTTISSGVMAALRRRGLTVQGFKVGPDYIDPGYHTLATGIPSRNLDSWMLSHDAVGELFHRSAVRADISVIEGVMGVFDGHSGSDDTGSTAEVAKMLRCPVVLVLDVSKMSRSAAALVLGCQEFDPQLDVRGVILNRTGSEKHRLLVTAAIEQKTRVPVLGHLPRTPGLELPERHLGLVPAAEQETLRSFLDRLAGEIETRIDLAGLLRIAGEAPPIKPTLPRLFPQTPVPAKVRIAVAKDEAFNFYYQDNLDLLEEHGAELLYFSPLHDTALPSGMQGIYLGGGFPEVYAMQLSRNASMLGSIRAAGQGGTAIYAECGGLLYPAQGIIDQSGRKHVMVGLIPGCPTLSQMRLKLRYVKIRGIRGNPLAEQDIVLRGHEFHYSDLDAPTPGATVWEILEPEAALEGFHFHNVQASYVHLHFASHPSVAPTFVDWCSRSPVI